jgi:hypothetical protein
MTDKEGKLDKNSKDFATAETAKRNLQQGEMLYNLRTIGNYRLDTTQNENRRKHKSFKLD